MLNTFHLPYWLKIFEIWPDPLNWFVWFFLGSGGIGARPRKDSVPSQAAPGEVAPPLSMVC